MTINDENIIRQPVGGPPTGKTSLDMEGLSWILFGHAAFQYLNAASELGLYELLEASPGLTQPEIAAELGLAERASSILLLGTTALGTLEVEDGHYRLSQVIADLIKTPDWQRFKDTVAFEQYIVYEGQLDFADSLRTNTNVGLRRIRGTGSDLYHRFSQNPHMESVFYRYMRSWSELANQQLIEKLDWSHTRRLLDCGGGDAVNSIALAKANENLEATVLEIPATVGITESKIAEAGLSDRISVRPVDIHTEEFPSGYDTILFAHQLVIWTPEENTQLLRKAYEALPEGGMVVIFNSMSNDAGDGPVVAALDSVYFASLPAEGGMIYPWATHEECLQKAGFTSCERIPFSGWTPHGAIVAVKQGTNGQS
ncbi:methyltransferase [Streptomyces chartreusis]|uniref:methyltransferase n=1 Tax=Streptomyces chartreusis TaxID=1969 RepID=UPI00380B1225